MRVTIHPFCEGTALALNDAQYFSLATFRKNGKAVATAVWFAAAGDTFYVFSAGDAGKVKRIRAGSRTGAQTDPGARARARVAPCDGGGKVLGDWQDAEARLVTEPAEIRIAYAALQGKYGLLMMVTNFFARLSGRYQRRQLIAVTLSGAR